ncbi:MAG TPA: feruloyl-CoA synthase [Steroidobacteraceae bacterium]|jgi:feruloyl-CoA synthase|nr:feruloyl-CoA synthase [Steroidobacteraceae bacterium]
MTPDRLAWRPGSFAVSVHTDTDGSILLTPTTALAGYPLRVTDELERWAALAPERIFVAQRDHQAAWRRVSYAQALQQVRRLANALIALNLSPDRPLAILSGNSIEHLLLSLAALYIGVPYCPISPAYSQAAPDFTKLRYVMQLLTPGLVAAFNSARFERAILSAVAPGVPLLGDCDAIGERKLHPWQRFASDEAPLAQAAHQRVGADTIAKFLLTSGSTGHPKAVITTHRMLCSNQIMLRSALPFLADEPPVLVDWLPWNHTFGGSHNVGAVLFNGGTLYIDEGKPTAADFEATVRNLSEISPSVYFNVPKGFELLAQRMERDARLRESFYRRLRACFFAGAGLTQYTWDALDRQALAARGQRLPILSGLGATETAPSVTFTTPDTDRAGVIGLPAPGCVVKIAPVGDKRELRVRSPGVTPGYWRAPEQTRAAFDSQGFYRLGDAVRLIDPGDPTRGLVFDGRIAEDFKLSSGTWVSVGPLRAGLLQALAPLAVDVVIAGLNRDYLAVLIVPDAPACSQELGAAGELSPPELARDARLLAKIAARLTMHARAHTGGATRVRRAMIVPEAPSLDRGEITEKGSINQRLMLARWEDLLERLYGGEPAAHVMTID